MVQIYEDDKETLVLDSWGSFSSSSSHWIGRRASPQQES
jgi:hypothetical protein